MKYLKCVITLILCGGTIGSRKGRTIMSQVAGERRQQRRTKAERDS